MPIKKMLIVINVDTSAISIKTDSKKKPHLDVHLTPGRVLMPESATGRTDEADAKPWKLQIPILFTPIDLKPLS